MTASRSTAIERAAALSVVPRRAPSFLRRFFRQRGVPIAALLLGLVVIAAVFAPLIAPYDPIATAPRDSLQAPSGAHLLGTDQLGRDVFSRIIFGSRVSILVGIIAVGVAMLAGVPLGLLSGYFGGLLDHAIMRTMDAIIAFPALVLALAIVGALGPGTFQVMVAIGVSAVPLYARLTRGQVLSIREQDYVHAARALGASNPRVLARHVLPNSLSPLIVQGSLGVAFAILAEAGLSFLGVGVQPPAPTWGGMLSKALPLIERASYLSIFPGVAIFITVLAINMLGDALRDVLDPRLRGI
ncbi:MAG: ABC transporter permease [Chloroflexi bacterium]|nr:ABC transporter permease [Chloroflexota bacterium]